jgi:acyl-coenzyme A thioesterase PaaI-like protein
MQVSDLPFNQHIGLRVSEDRSVTIKLEPHHKNHLNTAHASVIYSAAEAASGEWIIQNLSAHLPNVLAVTRNGSVQYKKPGMADIHASVVKSSVLAAEIIAQVSARGMGRISIDVNVTCGDIQIATGVFEWILQKQSPRSDA